MTNQDILMNLEMGTIIELSHECKVYHGIDDESDFRIERVSGDGDVTVLSRFESEHSEMIVENVIVANQDGQEFKVRPEEIVDMQTVKFYNY